LQSLINHINQYVQLTDHDIDQLSSYVDHQRYRKKESLELEGKICRHMHFILSGCVKIGYIRDDGNEFINYFAVEGEWAVDLKSYVRRESAYSSIVALEDTEVLSITKDQMDALLTDIPKLEKWLRQHYEAILITSEVRINEEIGLTAEQKYRKFLKNYPEVDRRVPQKYVAAYLGISPEFLSMIKARRG